jgi:hypothetical protein
MSVADNQLQEWHFEVYLSIHTVFGLVPLKKRQK